MAAREHQAEPVVGDRVAGVRFERRPGVIDVLVLQHFSQPLRAKRVRTPAPEAVDGATTRRDRQPGAGVGRDAMAAPVGDRRDERILQRVFGQFEVAGVADERGKDSRTMDAKRSIDRLARGIRAHAAAETASSTTFTGRTSTDP
jgi:hypothetical protein